jgi:CRISPR/Cas system-associated endoribonuclease Cas2
MSRSKTHRVQSSAFTSSVTRNDATDLDESLRSARQIAALPRDLLRLNKTRGDIAAANVFSWHEADKLAGPFSF